MSLPYVSLVLQRAAGDCGIAALAMLLGRDYEDVLVAAIGRGCRAPHRGGMYTRQLQAASRRLGQPLALRRAWDLETDEGLLTVERVGPHDGAFAQHLVLLKFGLVWDTDGAAWEPETYFAQHGFRPVSLLVAA